MVWWVIKSRKTSCRFLRYSGGSTAERCSSCWRDEMHTWCRLNTTANDNNRRWCNRLAHFYQPHPVWLSDCLTDSTDKPICFQPDGPKRSWTWTSLDFKARRDLSLSQRCCWSQFFWLVTPCSWASGCRRFEDLCSLQLQGQAAQEQSPSRRLHELGEANGTVIRDKLIN